MAIENATIASTDTTILTVPANKRYAITTLMVCNTANANSDGSNDSTFDMYFIKSGQVKQSRTQVVNNIVVAGADTFTFDTEKVVLEDGDKVVLVGQAPLNLSAMISYLEV